MESRIALITGGSGGIGSAIVDRFLAENYRLCFTYNSGTERAQSLIDHYGQPDRLFAVRCDLKDESEIRNLYDKVVNRWGALDVLVNNAGSIVHPAGWRTITSEVWKETFDINLLSSFLCARAFETELLQSPSGRIVNVGSVFGELGAGAVVAYTASKAALHNLTRSLAKELAPKVTVNCVAPGTIDTKMTQAAGKDVIGSIVECTPVKRLGRPEEVAELVGYLAGTGAGFVTGQIVEIDGGYGL